MSSVRKITLFKKTCSLWRINWNTRATPNVRKSIINLLFTLCVSQINIKLAQNLIADLSKHSLQASYAASAIGYLTSR